MKKFIPKSSTLLFLIILIFLAFMLLGYKLLLENIENSHDYEQKLNFYKIQRETDSLLNKLLHKYSLQKDVLLEKHKEVLAYLEKNSYDGDLSKIHEKINEGLEDKPYNIFITDENLVIRNTTFAPDLNFDLSFATYLFEKHKKDNVVGISSPVFETFSMKFLSFTDQYLPKNQKRILQVSYRYPDIDANLKSVQKLIDTNPNIKNSTAYILFKDGYVGDFIFKSFKSFKPSLDEVNRRINLGRELSTKINDNEYVYNFYEEDNRNFKISYFSQQSAIYDEAKIIYSVIFDETSFYEKISKLNIIISCLSIFGIITIFIIWRVRTKEQLLGYKDKFIEHSVHEIKTPLSIINLNIQLRNKTFGIDKYSQKIEGALKTLENSYEDMAFLHTKDKIQYPIETLNLAQTLQNRVDYFKIIASTQNRKLEVTISPDIFVQMNHIELNRLIDNNISNTIKYSNIGSSIKISLENNILNFTSIGNHINDTKNIFEKYAREDESLGGHGLGLSIVKDICEKYNITINVTSSQKGKNIFSYTFI